MNAIDAWQAGAVRQASRGPEWSPPGTGRPLVGLALILLAWGGVRQAWPTGPAATEDRQATGKPTASPVRVADAAPPGGEAAASSPAALSPAASSRRLAGAPANGLVAPALPSALMVAPWVGTDAHGPAPAPAPRPDPSPWFAAPAAPVAAGPVARATAPLQGPPAATMRGAVARRLPPASVRTRTEAAHLLIAASRYGLDPFAVAPARGTGLAAAPDPPEPGRLAGSGWLFLRGGGQAALTGGPGAYGGSQAGSILRWRLSDRAREDVPERLWLFMRATGAGRADVEGAAGIAMRPARAIPLSFALERRFARSGGDATAAYAVIAPRPAALPGGFRLDAYAAGGMVVTRRRTGFHDAAIRIDTALAANEDDVRLGVGAWSGGQDGLHRLDLGPTVAVPIAIAGRAAQLRLDWRQRVAGDARPAAGPALTLAADF